MRSTRKAKCGQPQQQKLSQHGAGCSMACIALPGHWSDKACPQPLQTSDSTLISKMSKSGPVTWSNHKPENDCLCPVQGWDLPTAENSTAKLPKLDPFRTFRRSTCKLTHVYSDLAASLHRLRPAPAAAAARATWAAKQAEEQRVVTWIRKSTSAKRKGWWIAGHKQATAQDGWGLRSRSGFGTGCGSQLACSDVSTDGRNCGGGT